MRKYLIFLLIFLSVSLSFAQESTETPLAPTEEVVIPTEVVTEAPTEETVIPTEAITAEPTAESTAILEPTLEAPTVEPTSEATVTTPTPEPALSLWASDSFERQISPEWILPSGWASNGASLNIETANTAYFSNEAFSEVAVQGQFRLVTGSTVSVFVRNAYRTSLNSEGRLSIWRDDVELATTTILVNPEGHFLRLSAFGDTLRASLDGHILLTAQDSSYSTGQIGVRVDFNDSGIVTLDNFGVWIPTDMLPSAPATEVVPGAGGSTQALLPPNLTAPALNGVVSKLRPTFSWQARSGAVQYRLRIASNFSCSTIISGGEILTPTNTHTPAFDIPQGEYWYCVEAQDNLGVWSGFGEKRRFVINIAKAPLNQAVFTNSQNVALSWTAVTGATYDLQIATDSSFSITTDINGLTSNSYTYNGSYGQYYWRVAVNGNQLPMSLAYSFYISPPLPVASNASPPLNNGKYTNNINPILNWTVPSNWVTPPSGQSITYEFHLATDIDFNFMVAPPVTGIGTNNYQWTPTNLSDGRYYWRLRARTNLGLYGAWSATFNFRVDTVAQAEPNLNAPANNAFVTTARPAFTWAAVTGANRYLLEVSTINDFSTTVISVTNTTTSFAATSSLAQGEYFWRVRSIDAAGNYSLIPGTVRSFTVDYRTSPTSEQIFVSAVPRTITFRWTLVAGATGAIYTVEIDNNSDFSSIEHTSPARSTASWISPMLGQGRWYWRLVVTGYGTSEDRAFIISPALPNAPVLTSPANNSSTNDLSPLLQWNMPTLNNSGITGYQLQLSTTSTFAAPIGGTISVAITSHTIAPDLPLTNGTTYYWRLRAVTNLGAVGAWSSARYFRLDTTAPLAPNPISPINAASVTNTLPQLKWAASAGANRYEVRYGLVSDLSAVTPILVTTAYYNVATPLLLDTYYWQVRALDAAGNVSAWSAVQNFDVDSPTTAVSSPWYFTTDTPTLSWTPLYWADVYQIEVSTTSNFSNIIFTETSSDETTLSVIIDPLPDGVYYFRVRAQSQPQAGGGWGSWSAAETFTIDVP